MEKKILYENKIVRGEVESIKYELFGVKKELKNWSKKERNIIREILKRDNEIINLKRVINFIGDNIYNLLDLVENENKLNEIDYLIYEIDYYISKKKENF